MVVLSKKKMWAVLVVLPRTASSEVRLTTVQHQELYTLAQVVANCTKVQVYQRLLPYQPPPVKITIMRMIRSIMKRGSIIAP
jgi:hypothetical protein